MTTSLSYKKRPGTSGIRGQLYETKLISLINFRAQYDDSIEKFSLATNMDKVGIFDDICLRFKVKTFDKPFAVFIQAKHKENNTLLKNDLGTYFDSYLKIKQAFKPSNKDLIFKGTYDEIECFFVIYTTARGDCNYKSFESSFASTLNEMIGTAQCGLQTVVKNKDVECLYKVIMNEQVSELAKPIAKLFFDKITEFQIFMNDDLVASYHVILAQKFCDVSDIQPEGYRLAYVRQEFFDTNDEFLTTFKSSLYKEVIEKRKLEESELKTLVAMFFNRPSDVNILSKLIGCVITYKNGKLEFVNNKMINDDLKYQLSKLNVSEGLIDNAIEIAGREILSSQQNFKVPVAFGNKDLIIRKDERLTYLASRIIDLIGKSDYNYVITIDESVDKGFLKLNGGLAGAVGNLLVFDENSKMLKFNENFQELGDVAKGLLTKLKQNETIDLQNYRLDVKIEKFPKLTFECGDHDKNMAKDFFNRLLFYTNQADENGTGMILKEEIEKHKFDQVSKNSFLSQLVLLKYHEDIQNWWMSPNIGAYLTEENKVFVNAMKTVVSEPPMTVMNTMYEIKMKEANLIFYFDDMLRSLELNAQAGYIIITESILITLYKLKQYLKQRKDHVVLDMEYISKLLSSEYDTLLTELQNTNNEKIIIIVFNNIPNIDHNSCKKFVKIAKKIKHQLTIIITDNKLLQMVQEIFSKVLYVVNDNKTNLTDLSEDTQLRILQKKILFQGQEIKLKSIIDKISKSFLKGDVLSKIIHNEAFLIGKAIQEPNYERAKHMYIGRRVCRNKKRDLPVVRIQADEDTLVRLKHLHYETCIRIKEKKTESNNNKCEELKQESLHIDTLHDIDDDVIVLTTKPGMGKSTLFTHLILQTKKIDQTLWIVRINLGDHVGYGRKFFWWQVNKTVIDILECLKFMCEVILGDRLGDVTFVLQELNNEPYLEYCAGNELLIFELKMFLHFYNRQKLIFLFDGFDEICPRYENEALNLLRILNSHPKYIKNKIWITSRTDGNIKTILEKEFEVSYDLENFSWVEQNMFLYMFWITNEILINKSQFEKIYDFIDFMSHNPDIDLILKKPLELNEAFLLVYIYINFIFYLKVELKSAPPRILNALAALYDRCFAYITRMNDFVTTPLKLYLAAHYFLDQIKDRIGSEKWGVEIDDLTFFEDYQDDLDHSKHMDSMATRPIRCYNYLRSVRGLGLLLLIFLILKSVLSRLVEIVTNEKSR